MAKEQLIVYTKNERDPYFRKSNEFASADVTLREDAKSSGSVERLSATILKAAQDQLYSMARQKKIEIAAKELAAKYSIDFKESFITNQIKRMKKDKGELTLDQVKENAEHAYLVNKQKIDALAEKKAMRESILKEISDDELTFRFDAKTILEYAAVHEVKKDRLYEDVKRVQEKFNNWTEKHFNVEKGIIEEIEENGVLFPHSKYKHGSEPEIEITMSKPMVHMVLFLSKSYLKFHLDSYVAIGTPNAMRLYELLIDCISGNLFYSGKDLTLEFLQNKFGTNYKHFSNFLQAVITPALEKINSELNTNVTFEHGKKKGRMLYSIKFVISDYDKKVLHGIRDENIDEAELYSFEYYLTLVSLGGRKAQGGLRTLYESIRSQVNRGEFFYFGKTREEVTEDYMKNLNDAEELEVLIREDAVLSEKYVWDGTYMNIIDKQEIAFVGATASESLEYIRSNYLIPLGVLSPALPYFDDYSDEKEKISKILPLKFKLTKRKTIEINKQNYDTYKMTIEPHLTNMEMFEFDTLEQERTFCEVFGIKTTKESIEAELVSTEEPTHENEARLDNYNALENLLRGIGNRSIDKESEKWIACVNKLEEEYGVDSLEMVIKYLSRLNDKALFWLQNITTPAKLQKHYGQIEQVCNIEKIGLVSKIRADDEIKMCIGVMHNRGESAETIEKEIAKLVGEKIKNGYYGEAPWTRSKNAKRMSGEALTIMMNESGFDNIFDYIEGMKL